MSMKISVCGINNSELLNKVSNHYNVEPVSVCNNETLNLYETSKLTYNYDNVDTVVFNGCVLDYLFNDDDIHPLDEQILLCALSNIDVVYVNATNMSEDDISKYHQYDEFIKGRVVDVRNIDELVIK